MTLRNLLVLLALANVVSLTAADSAVRLRSVTHTPQAPQSGQGVIISARLAPGLRDLRLHYQLVDPGRYLALNDPAFITQWTSLPMRAEREADGDTRCAVEMPATLQLHRRLVRYRFTGMDGAGKRVAIPPTNAPQPNYAYFVYDGVPAWTGAVNSKSEDPKLRRALTFDTNVMGRVQSYHLIGKGDSIEKVTWREQTGDRDSRYTGTLVVDGIVYDHIHYRARGGV